MDRVTVIIPTLNEEEGISEHIFYIQKALHEPSTEILLVDGGSTDKTCEIASALGVRIIELDKSGRAYQMNRGAQAAKGNILHFIHADSFPPRHFDLKVKKALSVSKVVAGCFRSRFLTRNRFLLACSWMTRWPLICCRGGGQTLFVKKEVFNQLQGFKSSLSLMEEYEFILRLKRKGKFYIYPENTMVSTRKYQVNGTYKLHFSYSIIFILFFMGFSQQGLEWIYRQLIRREKPYGLENHDFRKEATN